MINHEFQVTRFRRYDWYL